MASTQIISSDILEQQFGPTEINVLYQTDNSRIICTKTKVEGKVLELSFVSFIKEGADKFPEVHQAILDGKSMGKAFRDRGIEFKRKTQVIKRNAFTDISSRFTENQYSTVILVSVLIGPDYTPYAEIFETYNSEVSWS